VTLRKHTLVVLAVVASSQAVVALAGWLDRPGRAAAAYGAAVAAVNAILSHTLMVLSEGRSTRAFLKLVLGGMAGRLALVIAAVLLGILALGLPRLPLLVSLLGHFVAFLVLEMVVLHGASSAARAEAR
jgi:hypothetical protein